MDSVRITRKRSFASALMPYWVIVSDTGKRTFLQSHFLAGDICDHDRAGRPVARIDISELDKSGIRISNGQSLEIQLPEDAVSVFACAAGGSFSNELPIEEIKGKEILITTKGGFNTVSYPHIEAVDR